MRKADYNTLASVLCSALVRAAPRESNPPQLSADNDIRRAEIIRIATRLSEQLNVDRTAFLKACGID